MAGAIFAERGRGVVGHGLRENVAGRAPLYEGPANIANHRRQPVFFLEGVRRAYGDTFLAEARIQAADNFILPEELDHGVFNGAIEAHVVVQIEILLARQFAFHAWLRPAAMVAHSAGTALVASRAVKSLRNCSRDTSR